jgi:hypothetical protein
VVVDRGVVAFVAPSPIRQLTGPWSLFRRASDFPERSDCTVCIVDNHVSGGKLCHVGVVSDAVAALGLDGSPQITAVSLNAVAFPLVDPPNRLARPLMRRYQLGYEERVCLVLKRPGGDELSRS